MRAVHNLCIITNYLVYFNKVVILMERKVGTVSRGIRCPIIREGDNLVEIAVNSVLEAAESEGFELRD